MDNRKKVHKSSLSVPHVYDGRVTVGNWRNETIAHKVFYPDELPENTPGVELMAKLTDESIYGKEYAQTKRGKAQVRIAGTLTPKGAAAWRAAHMCSCGSILTRLGTCMLECGN